MESYTVLQTSEEVDFTAARLTSSDLQMSTTRDVKLSRHQSTTPSTTIQASPLSLSFNINEEDRQTIKAAAATRNLLTTPDLQMLLERDDELSCHQSSTSPLLLDIDNEDELSITAAEACRHLLTTPDLRMSPARDDEAPCSSTAP